MLRYARRAADPNSRTIRSALAHEFLANDLPGYTVALLRDRRAGPLDGTELVLDRAARGAISVSYNDAHDIIGRPAGPFPKLAQQLWLLLGVPGIQASGSYLDAEFVYAPRSDEPSRVASGQASPVLVNLIKKQFRPDLEDLPLGEPERLPGQRLHIRPQAFADLVATAARGEIAGDAARRRIEALVEGIVRDRERQNDDYIVTGSDNRTSFGGVAGSDGVWMLTFEEGDYSPNSIIAVTRRGDQLYAFGLGYARSVILDDVDGKPGPEIILSSIEGSGGHLHLAVFMPTSGVVIELVQDAYHGQSAFLNLDADPAKEVVISAAGDARFSDCNQCPRRRYGALLDFDEGRGRYRTVGELRTGADDSSGTTGDLFGISNTMIAASMSGDAANALARFRSGNPGGGDTALILQYGNALIGQGAFDNALRVIELARPFLVRQGRRRDVINFDLSAALAELSLNRPRNALKRLHALAPAMEGQSADLARSYWSELAIAAIAIGDATTSYDALRNWQRVSASGPGAKRSPSDGNLAFLYAHFGAWRAARDQTLTAIQSSLDENNYAGLARMFVSVAQADRRDHHYESAIDSLARALRITRSFDDPGSTALSLQTGAAVALDLKRPDLAIVLLEVALVSHTDDMWRAVGPDYLLLYGRALEQMALPTEAGSLYVAAARLSDQSAGLKAVQAWAEVGRLALDQSNLERARQAYQVAFNRISQGRRYTPTEGFKLDFLQNVDAVAEHHFALSRGGSENEIRQRATDLESWKFQVFRDLHGPKVALDPDVLVSAQRNLKPNEAYVSYFISDRTSFATITTSNGIRELELDLSAGAARRLRTGILAFMRMEDPVASAYIRQRRMPRQLHDLLQKAHRDLIAPLDLPGHVDTLLINEDEDLAGIPWPAVPATSDGFVDRIRWALGFPRVRSLLDRYKIAIVPSVELLLTQTGDNRSISRPLITGAVAGVPAASVSRALGIAGQEASHLSLPSLPQALREVRSVRAALGDRAVLLTDPGEHSGALTRRSLQNSLAGATTWHFAGHGVFNPLDPMASVIFLRGGHAAEWITANELSQWDLSHLNFVALSACQTGTSRPEVGGETFGMLRGLLGAGVRSALVMGWPVDDRASSVFYDRFYTALKTSGPSEAHRQASLAVRDELVHPFYWSAPALYGGWR